MTVQDDHVHDYVPFAGGATFVAVADGDRTVLRCKDGPHAGKYFAKVGDENKLVDTPAEATNTSQFNIGGEV